MRKRVRPTENAIRKKSKGRPATRIDPVVPLALPMETRRAIGAWAKGQPGQPDLSKAIRRLIDIGLDRARSNLNGTSEQVSGHDAKAHETAEPGDYMASFAMPENIKAFNEFWARAEQIEKRKLKYEEVVALYNREHRAFGHLTDYDR
jgi:hypothetical protein